MKILVVGDVHLSTYSSIIRSRDTQFSTRLINIINSLSWAEKMAVDTLCNCVIYLGDFFDKADVSAEELTALSQVSWNNLPHYMLTGNHEVGQKDLSMSSNRLFDILPNARCISTPVLLDTEIQNTKIAFLPYVFEDKRVPLKDLFANKKPEEKYIVFSHNDIKGLNYGMFISKSGYSISEINKYADLFINGHIHNGAYLSNDTKGINLGNLTGQNFSENAFVYAHDIAIVNTENLDMAFMENPYAFNFYKIDASDINKFEKILKTLKSNAVISVKCAEANVSKIRELISANKHIVESRLVIEPTKLDAVVTVNTLTKLDHLAKFKEYMLENVSNDSVMQEELAEVLK